MSGYVTVDECVGPLSASRDRHRNQPSRSPLALQNMSVLRLQSTANLFSGQLLLDLLQCGVSREGALRGERD